MSIFTQIPLGNMRQLLTDVMLATADIYTYAPTRDSFGEEIPAYTLAFQCPCGFKRIRISEQPSFTGVAKRLDGTVRLPTTARGLINSKSRIDITEGGASQMYEVVGDVHYTAYHVIAEVARVQQ